MNMNALKLKEEGLMISLEQLHKIKDYMNNNGLTHIKLSFLILHRKDRLSIDADLVTRARYNALALEAQENAEVNSAYPLVLSELAANFRIAGWNYSHFSVFSDSPTSSYKIIQSSVNEQINANKKMKMHTVFVINDPSLLNFVEINNRNFILI